MVASGVPVWVAVLSALAIPVIAVFAAAIALLQWRTACNKLIIDVFDKRFAAYSAVRTAIEEALIENIDSKRYPDIRAHFISAIEQSEFLFEDDVIEPLRKRIEFFRELEFVAESWDPTMQTSEEKAQLVTRRKAGVDALRNLMTDLRPAYRRYLRIKDKGGFLF